jgi:hypothetical protein
VSGAKRKTARHSSARPGDRAESRAAVFALVASGLACNDPVVIGEGQFSRPIAIASDPADPLPRLAWHPGAACPGQVGGCESFCTGAPDGCPESACLPLLIDSGTPLSVLPSSSGEMDYGKECLEVRAAGGLLTMPDDPELLGAATASFRFREAPMVRAPGDEVDGWTWEAGDDGSTRIGGVLGGNILRDFAIELRHLEGEQPTVAVFSNYPGDEAVLGDQGRAYIRVAYPGRLLGRLLSDRCEIGDGLDCQLSRFNLDPNYQELLFDRTRALVDACVAPPPCALHWSTEQSKCRLHGGGVAPESNCSDSLGGGATLLVATGVPGLVLFDDSATLLIGALDELPACDAGGLTAEVPACLEPTMGRLVLPGWPPLEQLLRVRVRSLGLVEGLTQPTGRNPCTRLRARLEGLRHQCNGFVAERRPVRPEASTGESIGTSALVMGEVVWGDQQSEADPTTWIETLIVPATAPPVIALRREVVPEGAQPDGMIGGALLRNTETVLDFTESVEHPGVRVRCLDPSGRCLAVPACSADVGTVEFEEANAGRTSCCFGLPTSLIAEAVFAGEGKQAPRVEDACCSALPRAAITEFQTTLDLCTEIDLP